MMEDEDGLKGWTFNTGETKMVYTIVLNIDYQTKLYWWDDQLEFSGSQPFGDDMAKTFDYVIDLLHENNFKDIIYNVENKEETNN